MSKTIRNSPPSEVLSKHSQVLDSFNMRIPSRAQLRAQIAVDEALEGIPADCRITLVPASLTPSRRGLR